MLTDPFVIRSLMAGPIGVEPLRTENVTVPSLTLPAVLVTVAMSRTVCDGALYVVEASTEEVIVAAAPTVRTAVAVADWKSAVPL